MAKQISSGNQASTEQPDLKRKLAWRMGFAGLMIVMLLGTLAVFDYLSTPDEPETSSPRFTEPVPVQKKEITQPVKQVEALPEPPKEEKKPAEPEITAAPVEPPSRPEVASQPVLPRTPSSSEPRAMPLNRTPAAVQRQAPAPVAATAPAVPRSAEPRPAEIRPAAQPEEAAPTARQQVAPAGGSTFGGRLFKGYALQAGVFSDVSGAEEVRAKLMLNNIPSTLEVRIHVGPFKTREEADAARAKMKELGIDAMMLMPPKGAVRR